MKVYGNYQYLETVHDVFTMLNDLKDAHTYCEDEALYIGLDTETKPPVGGHPDDALRWWGANPGYPFLYIVGWSRKLGTSPVRYFLIPEEFEWAFGRVVDYANEFVDGDPVFVPIEWVLFNRTFDLGMAEISRNFKIKGRTHEAFTALRVACFLPDWWDDKRLKAISVKFLDPKADEPQQALNHWRAVYEKRRMEARHAVLKACKFGPKFVKHYDTLGLEYPFHVKQALEEWEQEWPEFHYGLVPDHILLPYAGNDVRLTLMAFYMGMKLMKERDTLHIYQEEQDFYLHNAREQCVLGWAVDREKLERAARICHDEKTGLGKIPELTWKIKSLLQWDTCTTISDEVRKKGFNPNSIDQMKKLFAHVGLYLENLQETTLLKWKEKDDKPTPWKEAIEAYLDYKLYTKLHGTYVLPLLYWSQWDGVCHPSIRQDAAYTGRQSVTNPPLQTIPKKEVPEFAIRDFFVSPDPQNYRLWMFDFSGMEVSVFAEYCRDPVMLHALHNGADFHSMLALKAFEPARNLISDVTKHMVKIGELKQEDIAEFLEVLHVKHEISDHGIFGSVKHYFEQTKDLKKDWKRFKAFRQAAKTGMFAILYGAGPDALSDQMSEQSGIYISPAEAAYFKESFYLLYVKAREFTDAVTESISIRHALHTITNVGRRYGWIRNLYGRLYLLEPRDSYKGVNYLVQGSCADLLKRKLIAIDKMLKARGSKSRIILSIHDEIVFLLHKSEERELVPILKEMMEDNPELEAVKLKAEPSFCTGSWATKQEFDGDWSKVPV